MNTLLLIGGVVLPCISAFGGLFAWAIRRMDRRFDEAALDRRRIEMQASERSDRIEERCSRIEERCARIEERCTRIEERGDRLEARIDRVAGQLADQVTRLGVEIGRAQGAARLAVEAAAS